MFQAVSGGGLEGVCSYWALATVIGTIVYQT